MLPIVDHYIIVTLLIWRVPVFLMLLRISRLVGHKESVFLMNMCLMQPYM